MARDSDTVFLITIEPPLIGGDLPLVLARLRASWPPERLVELLDSSLSAVIRAAATCLGLTGSMEHCQALAPLLLHRDRQIVTATEHALWTIWMQAGSPQANAELGRAVTCLRDGEFEAALHRLRSLTATEPRFAEGHHQRAIALHALERYDEAQAAYEKTIELNPLHFAAMAGLGHVRSEAGDLAGALHHYRRALAVHPQLPEIREIVAELESALQKRVVA